MYTIDRQEMTVTDSRSDDSERPHEEVPKTTTSPKPKNIPATSGYTVDDRGLLNNYAILTPMYVEEPTLPTIEEKLHSKYRMIFAILITATAILIALIVS
jgi:hypothetical protein